MPKPWITLPREIPRKSVGWDRAYAWWTLANDYTTDAVATLRFITRKVNELESNVETARKKLELAESNLTAEDHTEDIVKALLSRKDLIDKVAERLGAESV